MPNILKYSNGWGHLIMSLSTQVVAVVLLLQHDAALVGVSVGLLVAVSGYWFISSAAHAQQQVAAASQEHTINVVPPATPVVVAPAPAAQQPTGPLSQP